MIDQPSIVPGQLVHGTNGAVGTVEAVESSSTEGEIGTLVVRSADELRRYRLPISLVRRVKREQDHDIVMLRAGADELDRYLIERPTAPTGATASGATSTAEPAPSQESEPILRVPVRAEELSAGTRQVLLGNVHIHRGVTTAEETLVVPVSREETVIEHIAPEDYDETMVLAPDEIVIPVIEERLVVEKRAVVKEYIRVRKNRIVEDREVTGSVRREYVEITSQPSSEGDAASPPLYRIKEPTT